MYDQEWFEVYHAIMQEGLGIGDNNQNPSTAIPALAPLRDAFVGFEREVCIDGLLHNKSYCWTFANNLESIAFGFLGKFHPD